MLGTGLIKCNHSRPLKCMQCMTAFAGIPLTSFLADVKLITLLKPAWAAELQSIAASGIAAR